MMCWEICSENMSSHTLMRFWSTPRPESHIIHVKQVPSKLQENQLYVKEECKSHTSSIMFLGYIISQEVVAMDKVKVMAGRGWPVPGTVKELQRFVGFETLTNNSFTASAVPPLLVSPCWKKAQEAHLECSSWCRIQLVEVSFHTCTYPEATGPRMSLHGWSGYVTVVQAILSQRFDERPKLHSVAFFSQKLSPAKRNYGIGNCELLAVKLAFEEWRHWLDGLYIPLQSWPITRTWSICIQPRDWILDKQDGHFFRFREYSFISKVWSWLMYMSNTMPYMRLSPSSNGQVEWVNQEFWRFLYTHIAPRTKVTGPSFPMGRICPELPASRHHLAHTIPVHAELPTATVPV